MLRFDLDTPSVIFVKIPGLTVSVAHQTPMLYKIWFSGGCYVTNANVHYFIRFMVDDLLLVDNKLLPNTENRQTLLPAIGNSLVLIDSIGASFLRSSDSTGSSFTCAKYEIVYLPPGVHVINAVVRTTSPSLYLHAGTLIVELIQYEKNAKINLQYPLEL
ncbi:unnamed protein product [Rotaria sp. Silwood2]|nr:unnamed protein product [Rotaria sp. Silwood2]CAF3392391.1 unnamed protein product [Rotaria sp. Silwood2]CAF4199476.1 unnamed protein product [Rotaria sp. Silwood2]CAF4679555.1 unnamed protein product [Rotaria sp. Silwood2]